jgi:hypothetical protein
MFLRLFVSADESPAGLLALAYLPSLLRIAPVRLIDPRRLIIGVLDGPWAKYSTLLGTPMTGPMINVVCTPPDRWTWVQKVTATKKDDPASEKETVSGRCELYTAGVRNVLITSQTHVSRMVDAWSEQANAAAKYEAIVVPVATAAFAAPTYVIPTPVTDHAALRRTILGV